MRSARNVLVLMVGAAALVACQKQQQNAADANQELAIDDNVAGSQLPANAQIETLPPDESSTTPSNQLQRGYDNPDVNDLGNGD